MTDKPIIELTTEIVVTYLNHNQIEGSELPDVIKGVHAALNEAVWETTEPRAIKTVPDRTNEQRNGRMIQPIHPTHRDTLEPAVPVDQSITADYIVCLEDGKRYKSMKQPLRVKHGLTPEQYRAKWGLPHDYPMIAPNYKAHRQRIAQGIGLGNKIKSRGAYRHLPR